MIEVMGLTKYYGRTKAIEDVTFTVEKGEILGFLGPNGAGKTTTMRILTCFLPPTQGTARIAGFDILEDSLEVRRRVGYMPENIPLYLEMTVEGYLHYLGALRGLREKKERGKRVDYAIEACGLKDRRREIIGKLSKGYRQRVGLAQALLHDPEVLILDEPTIGLDPRQILEVRQLIKNLQGEHTIILSTHILPEVEMVCQRVIIIDRGRLVAMDTPENLTRRLRRAATLRVEVRGDPEQVIRCLKSVQGVSKVQAEEGPPRDGVRTYAVEAHPDTDVREAVAAALVKGGFGLREMHSVDMTLEEIFLRLTTEEALAA